MNIIHVDTSKKYDVIIGKKLIDAAGEEISKLMKPSKVLVISDDKVAPLYFDRLSVALSSSGFEVEKFAHFIA